MARALQLVLMSLSTSSLVDKSLRNFLWRGKTWEENPGKFCFDGKLIKVPSTKSISHFESRAFVMLSNSLETYWNSREQKQGNISCFWNILGINLSAMFRPIFPQYTIYFPDVCHFFRTTFGLPLMIVPYLFLLLFWHSDDDVKRYLKRESSRKTLWSINLFLFYTRNWWRSALEEKEAVFFRNKTINIHKIYNESRWKLQRWASPSFDIWGRYEVKRRWNWFLRDSATFLQIFIPTTSLTKRPHPFLSFKLFATFNLF